MQQNGIADVKGALDAYLSQADEATRLAAYELGRRALAEGTGLIDWVATVHGAVAEATAREATQSGATNIPAAAGGFVLECFSPFEMTFRGASEANQALRHQNDLLEQEIRRIAHEIHDSAGQLLASVGMELEQLRTSAPAELEPRFRHIETLLDCIQSDLRRLSHELRPTILDDLGLLPALRALGEGVSGRSGLVVTVEGSSGGRLPPPIETALYRTAQEALTNVAKHARATRADARVERSAAAVRLTVTDDGVGFGQALPTPGGPSGLGLIGLRERIAPLGGTVRWGSIAHAHGTFLVVSIPLEILYAPSGSNR